jgi:hypothetical protein
MPDFVALPGLLTLPEHKMCQKIAIVKSGIARGQIIAIEKRNALPAIYNLFVVIITMDTGGKNIIRRFVS